MANKLELDKQTFFKVRKAQIRKFWGSFRFRTSVFSYVCQSANKVSQLRKARKSNKLFMSANLWICDLRNLFADRQTLL
jgi:hypothetical protein